MTVFLFWRPPWVVFAAAIAVALVDASCDGVLVMVAGDLLEASYSERCLRRLVDVGLMLLSEQPVKQEKFESAQQPTLRSRYRLANIASLS
jgi:hypothetical protein